MIGAKAAKRDWRKLCTLKQKLEEEYGLDCWDPDVRIEMVAEAERVEPALARGLIVGVRLPEDAA